MNEIGQISGFFILMERSPQKLRSNLEKTKCGDIKHHHRRATKKESTKNIEILAREVAHKYWTRELLVTAGGGYTFTDFRHIIIGGRLALKLGAISAWTYEGVGGSSEN